MTSSHPVLVRWSAVKRAAALPTSGQYITLARFAEDGASPNEGWSIVLEIQGDPYEVPCKANARFLMPDAPEERLHSGVRFEMLEGSRVTAEVEVL